MRYVPRLMIAAVISVLWGTTLPAYADTLHLNNGGVVKGIVHRERLDEIQFEVCGGVVNFEREEIRLIERGTLDEALRFRAACADQRQRRREVMAAQAIKEALEPKHIPFRGERHGVILDAVINNQARASLLMDTGAALIVLKRSVADKMGVDLETIPSNLKLALTDGREVEAKYVLLDTVRIGDKVAYGVEAAIMMEDVAGPSFADGLLGMSFLNRFNFKIDYTTNSIELQEHYR
ncbi:MAG: retroviral-like aspartic protease family protein [Candidatus Omnitrophica bacterium]|nr:retroviral-like aspartic protease family protein [Candidatus Omnitrophota bacterium]